MSGVHGGMLCIFTRAPVLGGVKRRLARDLGDTAALRAHECLVADTLARLGGVPGFAVELWIAGTCNDSVRQWSRRWALPVRLQRGDDLGERMADALLGGLERCPLAFVVGTDCPDVDAGYVRAAARALTHADVVIGPAEDGGFGLIGARRAAAGRLPALFREVPWGSATVLATTLRRAQAAGVSVARLREIWDVDTAEDWARFLAARRDAGQDPGAV
ncbi:MAG: TIGR04282 family arsenosugar biosynthesis glycosyltransferase [Pseudomonadota bacterium]